jgi:hypothetical protein
MPRRQKPPGLERWTWDEINAGRRMSKAENRGLRLGVALGGRKVNGRIVYDDVPDNSPAYYVALGIVVLFAVLAVVATWTR